MRCSWERIRAVRSSSPTAMAGPWRRSPPATKRARRSCFSMTKASRKRLCQASASGRRTWEAELANQPLLAVSHRVDHRQDRPSHPEQCNESEKDDFRHAIAACFGTEDAGRQLSQRAQFGKDVLRDYGWVVCLGTRLRYCIELS